MIRDMNNAFLLAAAILAGFTVAAGAQDAPKPVDLEAEYQSLINTERAFAKKSMDTNAKEAFLAFIADDGVLFNPDPEPGKALWEKRSVPDYTLEWWPTHADISRSADLGWTTGPWVLGLKDGKKLHGYFSTVWRKQADGTWRFATDMGASMPEAAKRGGEPGPLDPAKLEKFTVPVDPKEAEGALLDLDRSLGETAGKGLEEAYKPLLAEDVRLMRQGHAPFVGKVAVALRLSEEKGTFSTKPAGGGSSRAGDLGYVYGTYERKGDKPESGSYVRVWEREPGDTWKLALEVLSPRPAG
jgi:ketosteroid isomerase-like protein